MGYTFLDKWTWTDLKTLTANWAVSGWLGKFLGHNKDKALTGDTLVHVKIHVSSEESFSKLSAVKKKSSALGKKTRIKGLLKIAIYALSI